MRHHAALPLIVLLAALTATVVGATVGVLSAPAPAAPLTWATESAVRQFYAAANDAFRTGDTAPLDAVVAPDVQLPLVGSDENAGRVHLVNRFLALHPAHPDLHIVVLEIVADRDVVLVWVAIEGAAPGVPLALPAADPTTGLLDGFRVAGGRIVEAWGATVSIGVPVPVLAAAVDAPAVADAFVGLARLTLAPGAQVLQMVAPGPTIVAVETGTLAVQLDGTGLVARRVAENVTAAEEPTPSQLPFAILPGDRLTVPTAAPFVLRNEGAVPVTALIATMLPPDPVRLPSAADAARTAEVPALAGIFGPAGDRVADEPADLPVGVTVVRLARAVVPLSAVRRVVLQVTRLVVAPDASVADFRPAGPVLAVVESGSVLVVTTPQRNYGDESPSADERAQTTPAILNSGMTAVLASGDQVTIGEIGWQPVVLLLLTLDASATDAMPSAGAGS